MRRKLSVWVFHAAKTRILERKDLENPLKGKLKSETQSLLIAAHAKKKKKT